MKQLLVIGGTKFIGRNLVDELLKRAQFEITLFNRGQTNSHLFPNVNKIKGDRGTSDIKQLGNQQWDYVIDLSSYYPNNLEATLEVLNTNQIKRYVYISTVSVYDIQSKLETLHDETKAIKACSPDQEVDPSWGSYGERKAECERILQKSDLDYLILRPSITYGPHDHTDRFYYWLYQVGKGKPIMRPQNHHTLGSYTYVKDLVNIIVYALMIQEHSNIYNIVSHSEISIGQIIDYASEILQIRPRIIDAPSEFITKNNIKAYSDIPLWLDSNWHTFSNEKMKQDFNIPMIEFKSSMQETLAFYQNKKWPEPIFGLSEEKKLAFIEQLTINNG